MVEAPIGDQLSVTLSADVNNSEPPHKTLPGLCFKNMKVDTFADTNKSTDRKISSELVCHTAI